MKEDQKEVFKAWIDGETIQFLSRGFDEWGDCPEFKHCDNITFNNDSKLRIKPKNIITTTYITIYDDLHNTYSGDNYIHNLKLTWSPDGETLLKAEVI